jgi:tripartite-type tricarboxylate transporter receptor subunit TctC
MKKLSMLYIIIFLIFLVAPPSVKAEEQVFPKRTIEIIVPMQPGGTLDIATRLVSDQFGKELKVPVVVVNKPAASGATGTAGVAKGKPDGYTLLSGTLANLIMVYFFQENVSYNSQKDFLPLAYAGESPSLLVVKSTSPWKTFKELMDYAKANPGQLSFAAAGGVASTSSMNMQLIKERTGADIANVIYEGGGPALIAVLGGHVQMTSAGYPTLQPHIKAGALRPLATSKKIRELPGVPTFAELGFPEVLVNWSAFFAPARISKGVYEKLLRAFDKALKNPETMAKLERAGYIPETKTPAEISELMKNQYQVVSGIVKGNRFKK